MYNMCHITHDTYCTYTHPHIKNAPRLFVAVFEDLSQIKAMTHTSYHTYRYEFIQTVHHHRERKLRSPI